jgi:hypothetical protein
MIVLLEYFDPKQTLDLQSVLQIRMQKVNNMVI